MPLLNQQNQNFPYPQFDTTQRYHQISPINNAQQPITNSVHSALFPLTKIEHVHCTHCTTESMWYCSTVRPVSNITYFKACFVYAQRKRGGQSGNGMPCFSIRSVQKYDIYKRTNLSLNGYLKLEVTVITCKSLIITFFCRRVYT